VKTGEKQSSSGKKGSIKKHSRNKTSLGGSSSKKTTPSKVVEDWIRTTNVLERKVQELTNSNETKQKKLDSQ